MNVMTHIIPPSIPSTINLNNPKTTQTPSSLVDSSLVSYAMLLILHGLKSFLCFSGCLSMNLVVFGLILNMFGFVLNTYGLDIMPIHHSYFYTYQFSPVAHNFPSLALILMEPLKPLSLLFHALIFLIYQSFISLISDLYRCYIRLEY